MCPSTPVLSSSLACSLAASLALFASDSVPLSSILHGRRLERGAPFLDVDREAHALAVWRAMSASRFFFSVCWNFSNVRPSVGFAALLLRTNEVLVHAHPLRRVLRRLVLARRRREDLGRDRRHHRRFFVLRLVARRHRRGGRRGGAGRGVRRRRGEGASPQGAEQGQGAEPGRGRDPLGPAPSGWGR